MKDPNAINNKDCVRKSPENAPLDVYVDNVRVEVAHRVMIHGRASWTEAPLCCEEYAAERAEPLPQLFKLICRSGGLEPLELGAFCKDCFQRPIHVPQVLKDVGCRGVGFAAMGTGAVFVKREGVVHAIILVRKWLVPKGAGSVQGVAV